MRQRRGVQPGMLELALVHRRLARRGGKCAVCWVGEGRAGGFQAEQQLDCDGISKYADVIAFARDVRYLLVQRDFAVEKIGRQSMKVFDLLLVVGVELSHRRVEHGLAARGELFVLLVNRYERPLAQ